MTRVFGRGELKTAILDAIGDLEPANGYSVMQALADAVGGPWRPSPGAIYPALLGLEDAGLLEGTDDGAGARAYRLTAAGRVAREQARGTLAAVARRAKTVVPSSTLGALVDAFAAGTPGRARRLDSAAADRVQAALDTTRTTITEILEENNDG